MWLADRGNAEIATQEYQEQEPRHECWHRDADGRGEQAQVVDPGVLAQGADDTERNADDDREGDCYEADSCRDRELLSDHILDVLRAFRRVRRAEMATEHAEHVVEELTVEEGTPEA